MTYELYLAQSIARLYYTLLSLLVIKGNFSEQNDLHERSTTVFLFCILIYCMGVRCSFYRYWIGRFSGIQRCFCVREILSTRSLL